MKKFDIVVVGAGIAGTGLAYNLKKIGYKGKILIIDKIGPGADKTYAIRTAFEKIINEYGLPYHHKYKGLIFANYDEEYVLDCKPYSINYKDVCLHLLDNSDAKLKIEQAKDVNSDILTTDKNKYSFKYLVDCSGASFFLRKKFNMACSNRFWLAKSMVLENKENIDTDYMYWLTDGNGYFEEFLPFKDYIVIGDYQYTDRVDFDLINITKNPLRNKKLKKIEPIEKSRGVMPNSPHFPMYYKKRYLFLGDSFGNAPTSSGYGTQPILETSKILSFCIHNDCLNRYEKMWKDKYLESYLKYLALKYELHQKSPILKRIKNIPEKNSVMKLFKEYPEMTIKYLKDPSYVIDLPEDFEPKPTLVQNLFRAYYYLFLKSKSYLESLRKF